MTKNQEKNPRGNIEMDNENNMKTKEEMKRYIVKETSPLVFQIREKSLNYEIDLSERTFEFAVDIILLLRTVSYKKENDVVRYQLAKSGTSVGVPTRREGVTGNKFSC